jgi:crotonobetainyl-CoA:carnitine CoA-transferase CaiB-like acyl-CoA transferase
MEIAERHHLPCFPIYSIRQMAESPHVQARGSLVDVERGGHRFRMPAPALRLSASSGEPDGPRPEILGQDPDLPLAGIRVLDLGQIIALPFCTQWLAWLGAEIILVESNRHQGARAYPPYATGMVGPETSGLFNSLSMNKKSCAIDLSTAEGRDIVRRLVSHCDVMVDNFATGVIEKFGLGYDDVRGLRPDIVMLSLGAFGRSGPMKDRVGLHSAVIAYSGMANVTGYPGGRPRMVGGFLPDSLSGTYCCLAILAALHQRRRTGTGQYIEGAMYEMLLSLFPEAVIDETLNGREPERIGSRSRFQAPHNIYHARGDDAWIAISVASEVEWDALCRAARRPEWRDNPRFATMAARLANVDALDAEIERWTRQHRQVELAAALQEAGVTAGPVLKPDEVLADRQLNARGAVIEVDHPIAGRRRHLGLPWQFGSPIEYHAAPLLGEHTREILTGLLGIGGDEYEALRSKGVLG